MRILIKKGTLIKRAGEIEIDIRELILNKEKHLNLRMKKCPDLSNKIKLSILKY